MPSEEANNRVFEILKLTGDTLKEKREVTHWFYFDIFADLLKFEEYANDIGFYTVSKRQRKSKNFNSLLLLLGHMEQLNKDQTDFDTLAFFEIAPNFNGIYDGWETSITPSEPAYLKNLTQIKE